MRTDPAGAAGWQTLAATAHEAAVERAALNGAAAPTRNASGAVVQLLDAYVARAAATATESDADLIRAKLALAVRFAADVVCRYAAAPDLLCSRLVCWLCV